MGYRRDSGQTAVAHRGPAAAAGIQAAGSPAGTGCTREEVSVRYEQSQKLLKIKKKKRKKEKKKNRPGFRDGIAPAGKVHFHQDSAGILADYKEGSAAVEGRPGDRPGTVAAVAGRPGSAGESPADRSFGTGAGSSVGLPSLHLRRRYCNSLVRTLLMFW